MKTFPIVLSCVGLMCAALPAMAETRLDDTTAVRVPAGPLDDAVEVLAKQAGVNVIYPGDLLDGRTTSGVTATLSPNEAFSRLLDGTSLVFTEERGAMRIAKAQSTQPIAAAIQSTAPVTGLPPAGSECHRVLEGHNIQRFCGQADQWKDLQARVGFRCKTEAKQDELCASAAEWKRLRNTRIKWLTSENKDDRALSTNVLADSSPWAASVCHRTIQSSNVVRYCGTADQWQDLEARVGFACRKEGTRDELCGSASQWKRWDLARSTQRVSESFFRLDEATDSAARNNPTNTFSGPTVGAPAVMPMNTPGK